MIAWPEPLILDLARRRAVLFLGAGVSCNSVGEGGMRPPSWREFLNKGFERCPGSKKHIKKLIKDKDFLTACEIIKERMDEVWPNFLDELFVAPKYQPSELHRSIYGLDASLVLTPNFDKIYDNLAQSESNGTVKTKTYYDEGLADAVRGNSLNVMKVHGTIDNPNRMIFTRYEYLVARRKHPAFYTLLDALIVTHTFLFIGCGLNDPDIRLFLEKSAQVHPDAAPHYITLPKVHSDIEGSIRRNLNLKVLAYSKKEDHKELGDSLKDLVDLVDQKRMELARTQRW